MPDVQTVNPETTENPDSEGSKEAWVDPIFTGQNPGRMSDEGEAPEGEAPAADGEAGEPTKEQLEALIGQAGKAEEVDAKKVETEPEGKPEAAPAKGDEAKPEEGEAAAKAEGDEGTEEGEEPPEKVAGKKPRRRSRSRRERRASERRILELEGRVQTLTHSMASGKPADDADAAPDTGTLKAAPKLEDFDYDSDQWSAALTDWTQGLISAERAKAGQAKAAEETRIETERFEEVMKVFDDRQEEARKRHDDYDEVVYDETRVIPEAAAAIIWEAESGPEIAYWLATHQDEAARLGDMTNVQVAREIGRIEATLMAEQAPALKPATDDKPVNPAGEAEPETPAEAAEKAPASEPRPQPRPSATQAPEPIVPIAGGAVPNRDPGKMGMDEYAAGRRSGKIR